MVKCRRHFNLKGGIATRKLVIAIICLLTINGVTLQAALAEPNPAISVADPDSVSDAVARITATLESQGSDIILVVNHSAAAGSVGLELAPTQVIFARPSRFLERILLKRSDTIGIDLPQKFLVWEDANDVVNITYNDPFFIAARHNIQGQDARLEAIAGALRRFALLGAGRDPEEVN
jgi:uncharacterized protein (DUF302 family)